MLALAPFRRAALAAALDSEEKRLRQPLDDLVSYGLLVRHGEWYEASHALIHTYASEKVLPGADTLRRLGAFYDAFARDQRQQGAPGYARLDGERPHIMSVLRKCVELGESDVARGLAWAIEEAIGGKVDIEIHDIPWFEGSPAQGDQDVWIARW